jgi:hypothetical protein
VGAAPGGAGGGCASASDTANIVGAKRPSAAPSSENESTFRRDSFSSMSNFLTSTVAQRVQLRSSRSRRRKQGSQSVGRKPLIWIKKPLQGARCITTNGTIDRRGRDGRMPISRVARQRIIRVRAGTALARAAFQTH